MSRYLCILCIAFFSINSSAQTIGASEITTYYFIRHAEKDRSDPSQKDAHLTELGHKRAQHWERILQHIPFDAVYSTDYHRTKETGQPIANKNGVGISVYSTNTYFDKVFRLATKGKTVLIVGHSNTTPEFVNAILGYHKYEPIDDANNGNLYIVTLIDGQWSDILLTIN